MTSNILVQINTYHISWRSLNCVFSPLQAQDVLPLFSGFHTRTHGSVARYQYVVELRYICSELSLKGPQTEEFNFLDGVGARE